MDSSRKRPSAPPAAMPASAATKTARRGRPARQASGNWHPDWEPFAKLDPAFTERMVGMTMAPAVSGALDAKTIEFIGIALAAAPAQLYVPGIRRHVRRALDLGATKEEITAVLQCASLQGFHSLCVGAPILREELEAAGLPRERTDQPETPR